MRQARNENRELPDENRELPENFLPNHKEIPSSKLYNRRKGQTWPDQKQEERDGQRCK